MITRTPRPPFILGNTRSSIMPPATKLRQKRLESFTMNPSITPPSRSASSSRQAGRSNVVPEKPSSAYSRTMASPAWRSQYWRMICCWLTMLLLTPSSPSSRLSLA